MFKDLSQKSIALILAAGAIVITLCVVGIILMTRAKQDSTTLQGEELCQPENILGEVKKVYDLMHKYDDYSFVANLTPQQELSESILKMQDVRYELEYLEVPSCVVTLKQDAINYMNGSIIYLAHFMGGMDRQQVNLEITAADEMRKIYDAELARLTGADLLKATSTPIPLK